MANGGQCYDQTCTLRLVMTCVITIITTNLVAPLLLCRQRRGRRQMRRRTSCRRHRTPRCSTTPSTSKSFNLSAHILIYRLYLYHQERPRFDSKEQHRVLHTYCRASGCLLGNVVNIMTYANCDEGMGTELKTLSPANPGLNLKP